MDGAEQSVFTTPFFVVMDRPSSDPSKVGVGGKSSRDARPIPFEETTSMLCCIAALE